MSACEANTLKDHYFRLWSKLLLLSAAVERERASLGFLFFFFFKKKTAVRAASHLFLTLGCLSSCDFFRYKMYLIEMEVPH